MLSLADAHTQVAALCEPSLDPALTDQEIDAALLRTALASIWLPSTAYTEGQRVVPTIPMGRVFICTLAGISGTTAPSWLIAPAYDGPVNPLAGSWWGAGPGPFVEDVSGSPWFWGLADNTCAWRMYGAFGGEIYDVRAAGAECWRVKARKAANRYRFSDQGTTLDRQQVYRYCMEQAASLQPVRLV